MLPIEHIEVYSSKKILGFNECISLISKLKADGKIVGLCHGGFDLLHPGHAKHFESAKKLCDVLIVSVTSDKFVSGRKGSGRPIFTEVLRAYMIASVSYVDYVVITDFKLATDILQQLKPSYYIKGPDFITKTTPGITAEREAITAVGGEMRYTNDPKLATTSIIEYIKTELDKKKMLLIIDRDGTLIEEVNFLGRNIDWKKETNFNDDVLNLILTIQTKFNPVKIVVSNQAGVARRYFDCEIVESINKYINDLLLKKDIKIDDWQYCPDVDSVYALAHPEFNINLDYVKEKTKRKPNIDMVFDALKKLNMTLDDFNKILVIGDRHEDEGLANNLNAKFIDVKNKNYDYLIKEFEEKIK